MARSGSLRGIEYLVPVGLFLKAAESPFSLGGTGRRLELP